MKPLTVCQMNDSFPPLIDGVANATMNYAYYYKKNHGQSVVATPYNPGADDGAFPFPVVRYRSFNTSRFFRYRAGYPFSVDAMSRLKETGTDLIHSHCPFMSTILARTLRDMIHAPIVFTYHTKFDIDIANTIPSRTLRQQAVRLILNNINACDEIWAVSRGAGENLRSLGCGRDYIVMENGVDYPRGAVSCEKANALCKDAFSSKPLPAEGAPIYLFVGRMMWYKGLRPVFDALARLKAEGRDFRFVLIGGGAEQAAMEEYTVKSKISDKCLFLGEIRDRDRLRAWYSSADLFLFPSTYDTNGLVVREAAACGLASMLIAGSCAAEGVTDGRNGFLCEENADSIHRLLSGLSAHPEAVSRAGRNAMDELYLSWEESVARASARYQAVLENYRSRQDGSRLIRATADMMEGVEFLRDLREAPKEELTAMYQWQKAHLGNLTDRLWEKFRRLF